MPNSNDISVTVSFGYVLVQSMKEQRENNTVSTIPKRKMLNIKPGQSVSNEECLKLIEIMEANKKVKKEKLEKPSKKKIIKENKENSKAKRTKFDQ